MTADKSPGYGYSGIVIAMLAGLHPLGVIAAGTFVAGVLVGADSMSRAVGVPTYIADVIVATSLIAVLVAGLLTQYRVRWKGGRHEPSFTPEFQEKWAVTARPSCLFSYQKQSEPCRSSRMTELLDILVNPAFWIATLRVATPLILGTLGVLLCERAGVLNLGIEGIMVAGAFTGWLTVYAGHGLWTGVLVAALTGAVFGLLHAWLTVGLALSQHVSGLGITLLATALSYYGYRVSFPKVNTPPTIEPFAPMEWLGIPILSAQTPLTLLALLLVPLLAWVLLRTPLGLAVRMVGENPQAAEGQGISVVATRTGAIVAGSAVLGCAAQAHALGMEMPYESFATAPDVDWIKVCGQWPAPEQPGESRGMYRIVHATRYAQSFLDRHWIGRDGPDSAIEVHSESFAQINNDHASLTLSQMNCQATRRGIRFTARAEADHGDRAFRITTDAGHKPGDVRFRTNQRR